MPSASSNPSLSDLLTSLNQSLASHDSQRSLRLLSQAKLSLLEQNALIPNDSITSQTFTTARSILETGAIVSIRTQDPESFNRYFSQLQPFYDYPTSSPSTQRSKITGLYLLLLLSQGDYAGFHTVLEGLMEMSGVDGQGKSIEDDPFIRYPVDLERSLMEGSYDKVWRSTKGDGVPSEEFALFSEVCTSPGFSTCSYGQHTNKKQVLIHTIRAEIASCAQSSYASLPISNAKNLLFLDSEGAVVSFAQQRGWVLKDGRIYFPDETTAHRMGEKEILVKGGEVIENTLGYARELETIV